MLEVKSTLRPALERVVDLGPGALRVVGGEPDQVEARAQIRRGVEVAAIFGGAEQDVVAARPAGPHHPPRLQERQRRVLVAGQARGVEGHLPEPTQDREPRRAGVRFSHVTSPV